MVPAHIQHTFNGKDIIAMRDEGVVINNAQEFLDLVPEIARGDRAGLAQRFLQKVVEAAEPFVDLDVQLDLVPGGKQNHGTAGN